MFDVVNPNVITNEHVFSHSSVNDPLSAPARRPIKAIYNTRFVALKDQIQEQVLTPKAIAEVKPNFAFEAYRHVLSPIFLISLALWQMA